MKRKNKTARGAALAMLAMRAYSIEAVRSRLLEKDYDEDETEEAVNRLIELGYLDDEKYAAETAERLTKKGWDYRQIQYYMTSRGVDRDTAREALDAFEWE